MSEKRYGLQLKGVNGESSAAQTVPPLAGFFFVDTPTPVGGEGELPLDAARNALKDPVDEDGKRYEDGYFGLGDVLELKTIKSGEVEDAKTAQVDARDAARNGIKASHREARDRPLTDEERQRLNDETIAAGAADGS